MKMNIPDGENLVVYYILPMVQVNKVSFGRSFKNAYLSEDGSTVYVELTKNMHNPLYKRNPNHITDVVKSGVLFAVFKIPAKFYSDVLQFMNGQYSKFDSKTKKLIYQTSSLPYNATKGSFSVSHPVLQALDKTKTLRDFLQKYLDINTIPNSDELIDPPNATWYIEHRLNVQT